MKNGRTTKPKVSHARFEAEEVTYDPPASETEKWRRVGRGPSAIFAKPKHKTSVTLDPDVAAVFQDAGSVNKALRKLIEAMPQPPGGKRKTA